MQVPLLLIATYLVMYSCYIACGRSFKSPAALKLHQNKCEIAQHSYAESLKRKLTHDESTQAAKLQQAKDVEVQKQAIRESEATVSFAPDEGTTIHHAEPSSSRIPRVWRKLCFLQDFMPHSLSMLPRNLHPPPPPISTASPVPASFEEDTCSADCQHEYAYSTLDESSLYRCYRHIPSHDPEASISIDELHGGSSVKSLGELDRFVHDVLLAEDFDQSHLKGFSAVKESQRLDDWLDEDGSLSVTVFTEADGWRSASVQIRVPCEGVKHRSENDVPMFEVPGVYFHQLVAVIKASFESSTTLNFHWVPFRLYAKIPSTPEQGEQPSAAGEQSSQPSVPGTSEEPSNNVKFPHGEAERVYSELYNSEEANLEYERIRDAEAKRSPAEPKLETVIAFLMLCRSTPDASPATYGKAASNATYTHCKRELLHAIWTLLLDEEFLKAYEEGIIIRILLATIRFLGNMPCIHCVTLKQFISALGSKLDMRHRTKLRGAYERDRKHEVETARRRIYERGNSVVNKTIEGNLRPFSWVPTRMRSIEMFEFDFYKMLVVDQLHEFELGIWKATFIHLVRILYATGDAQVQELNSRYRRVPSFGRDTIRRFVWNVSAMKAFAARDFEDLLQCIIPVFDGLLDEPYNSIVIDLL
ncbi:hypothetical protein NM688_g7541 [Phlebia brevispora]|uniref:Uncharacterized protein n=1 Tax=Phlebia brevispora TaxID=194682 RepID=A0ACC1S4A6_9APHY|nr:hypothetical protein NM688_g7541 [Phlebia brevispora]